MNPEAQRADALSVAAHLGVLAGKTVTLAHGGGGKAMVALIEEVFLNTFGRPAGAVCEDQARLQLAELSCMGDQLAFTTDSYVVDPLFFPGGNIGTLSVNGTVNDLAVGGARPFYLSCSVILEEGYPIEELRRVAQGMQQAADQAGVRIVTGDTKVVPRGAADKLFINTAGIGVIPKGVNLAAGRAAPGDLIVTNGFIGDHGAAIVDGRGELVLEHSVHSDTRPLNGLVEKMLSVCPDIRCMRDATRGGVAAVLNEFAAAAGICIRIDERAIPVRAQVRGICELLGLDPLYLANEGKLLAVVPAKDAEALVAAMRTDPAGADAVIIGQVGAAPSGLVTLATALGAERVLDMLVGEQLPRIC